MRKIIVLGNLNIDILYQVSNNGAETIQKRAFSTFGGTAFNAAVAFKEYGFEPIIFANIGNDRYGQILFEEIQRRKIKNKLRIDSSRPTGICEIEYFVENGEEKRQLKRNKNDANIYDPSLLTRWLENTPIERDDLIFAASDFITRNPLNESKYIFEIIHNKSNNLIVDLVPHNVYKKIDLDSLKYLFPSSFLALIGELKTIMYLINSNYQLKKPHFHDWDTIFRHFSARFISLRYGKGEISKQQIVRKVEEEIMLVKEESDTGYDECKTDISKKGFGDKLTAKFVHKYL